MNLIQLIDEKRRIHSEYVKEINPIETAISRVMNNFLTALHEQDKDAAPTKRFFSGGYEYINDIQYNGDTICVTVELQWNVGVGDGKEEQTYIYPAALVENPTPEGIKQYLALARY
jgi:hypothetical protein